MDGFAVGAIAIGGLFAYGGITGKSPLEALHAITLGHNPSTVAQTYGITPATSAAVAGNPESGAGSSTTAEGGPGGGTPNSNKTLGFQLAQSLHGWTGDQLTALDNLWTKESGWNNTADTRKTGAGGDGPGSSVFAYGIAQARPATKYPKAGWPPDLGGQANPRAQIEWGLNYIKSVYGSPANAWAHETANNWY